MTEVTTLRDETRHLLATRPANIDYKTIAEDTGITVGWIKAFAVGQSKHPSVVWVETLNVYLKKLKSV
jgi:hypothetical protein